jgi:hypothetical protein
MYSYSTELLNAIACIESNCDDKAIGDGGEAVGRYQIHKIYVDDVNRIAGTSYSYDDRYDPVKSEQMVIIYLTHYGDFYTRVTGKTPTAEVLARIHNGGPYGYRKKETIKYWNKVKKKIRSN